jgi:Flp pilus assembly protein TadD
MNRTERLLIAAVTCALLGDAARAGDSPATFDEDWQGVRRCIAKQLWEPGAASIRRLFAEHENDAQVIAHLAEIEEALQVCLYRKAHRTLSPPELFGPSATLGDGCALDCKFTTFDPPQWVKSGDRFLFVLPFVDECTLEAEVAPDDYDEFNPHSTMPRAEDFPRFGLCAPGASGGYQFTILGHSMHLEGGTIKYGNTVMSYKPIKWIRVSHRSSGAFGLEVNDPVSPDDTRKYAPTDRTNVGGQVWFGGAGVRSIRLKGRLDKARFDGFVAQALASGLDAWKKRDWSEEREIPAWARMPAPGAGAHAFSMDLPPDAPKEKAAEIARLVEALVRGDRATRDAVLSPKSPWQGGVGAYLRALASLTAGRADEAEARLVELDRLAPSFAPARLLHGIARLRLRRLDQAKIDLDAAKAAYPTEALVYEALADVALLEGDVDGAAAVLREAAAHGAGGATIDDLATWVQRAQAGPKRPLAFVGETPHFRVSTDVSRESAAETAASLEAVSAECATLIGPPRAATGLVHVWEFASRKGFDAWTGTLAPDGADDAGAYLVRLRQFALWATEDAAQFQRTLRHEACRHFLRQWIDDPPPWLEEGLAQSFEIPAGKNDVGTAAAGGDARRRRDLRARYVPLPELLGMDRASFVAKGEVTYPQSLELVSMLRTTKDPKLTALLADLLAAMRAGRSKDAVAADVVAPAIPALRARFEESIR